MARPDARAVAGYYAAQRDVVEACARMVGPAVDGAGAPVPDLASASWAMVDPCAADGDAALTLLRGLCGPDLKGRGGALERLYACELEETRHTALVKACGAAFGYSLHGRLIHGDAFRVRCDLDEANIGASILWLNPPYDQRRGGVRPESAWLERWTPCLAPGGLLFFVVPYKALAACAATLVTHYERLVCYRFPDATFPVFGQVVVVGVRRAPLPRPAPSDLAMVRRWVDDPNALCGVLQAAAGAYTLRVVGEEERAGAKWAQPGFAHWELRALDVATVAAHFTPWRSRDRRGVETIMRGVLPETGVAGLRTPIYSTAMPLCEGHVAAALACNVYDGVRLTPNTPGPGKPPVFAKATGTRVWAETGARQNDDGEDVAIERVQQPHLAITALDTRAGRIIRFPSTIDEQSADDIGAMSAADFVREYSQALYRVLGERCVPLYDPEREAHTTVDRPQVARALFAAQEDRARACVRLLDTHGCALLLGATGTGKTSIAAGVISTLVARPVPTRRKRTGAARRVLVVCPPILLDSWTRELAVVIPHVRSLVIDSIDAAETFARDKGPIVGIVADTMSKLEHARAGFGESVPFTMLGDGHGSTEGWTHRETFQHGDKRARETRERHGRHLARRPCARCGAEAAMSPSDLANKRARCKATSLEPRNTAARLALALIDAISPVWPDAPEIVTHTAEGHRHRQRMLKAWVAALVAKKGGARQARWATRRSASSLRAVVLGLARELIESGGDASKVQAALYALLAGIGDDVLTSHMAQRLWYGAACEPEAYRAQRLRDATRAVLLLMTPCSEAQTTLAVSLAAAILNEPQPSTGVGGWLSMARKAASLRGAVPVPAYPYERPYDDRSYHDWARKDGAPCYDGAAFGSAQHALNALKHLLAVARFTEGAPCDEPLYQSIPQPRRVPLGRYLAHRHRRAIDLVIVDEVHRNGNMDSAQSQAMGWFRGRPMLCMTGSFGNGFAASMFHVLYTISPSFRAEFPRGKEGEREFVRKCGFVRQVVEDRDEATGAVVAYGSQSSRVVRKARTVGDAPGLVPTAILQHILPVSVVLHMADLNVEIPYSERVHTVDMLPEQEKRYAAYRDKLMDQIARDRRTKKRGALFGAMGEVWGAPTVAIEGCGNGGSGAYDARYPERHGGDVVASFPVMPAAPMLPSERVLIERIQANLADGRNTIIFAWHTDSGLFQRLARLIEAETGERCPVLLSSTVKTRDREKWLRTEIVGKARVLLVNPACVETGLNVLTWFSRVIWYELPGCNANMLHQATSRVHRLGQTLDVLVEWILYARTAQQHLHRLLLLKLAEIQSVAGADPRAALMASGVGVQEGMSTYDLGRALYRIERKARGENSDV